MPDYDMYDSAYDQAEVDFIGLELGGLFWSLRGCIVDACRVKHSPNSPHAEVTH